MIRGSAGAGRRRSWSPEEKSAIVAESYVEGETVCAVARRHGLTPQQLFGWRREAARARRQVRDDKGDMNGAAFAPVIVESVLPRPDVAIAPHRGRGAAMIEIVIGAATVRVSSGTDLATLTTALRAVRAAT